MLHADSFQGVVPFGRLSGQHDAVGSIQDCIGHVTALRSGRARLLDHALQHLGGDTAFVRCGLGGLQTQGDPLESMYVQSPALCRCVGAGGQGIGVCMMWGRVHGKRPGSLQSFLVQDVRSGGGTHLCGTDDGLPSSVAPTNHHLLSKEDLLCGDLNA